MKSHNGGRASDDDGPAYPAETQQTLVSQYHYDPDESAELTTAVVFAIADAMNVSPSEVKSPPVYECVDLAALESTFFGPDVAGNPRQGVGTVEFEYNAYTVTISSDGWVQVYEPSSGDN